MNYQPNQPTGNYYPQQPQQGYPQQSAPQGGMTYPPMQPYMQPYMQPQQHSMQGVMPQMQQTGPIGYPVQQMPMGGFPQQEFQPMQQTESVGYPPQQDFPPVQQTGPMGFAPQQDFPAQQPNSFQPASAPVQPRQPVMEKTNPLQAALDYIKAHDLMFLAIAAALGVIYALYVTFSYAWLTKLLPHIIVAWLSAAGNIAVCVTHKKEFGIVTGAGYIVAALLFLNRFYLLIPSAALCAWDFFWKKNA